MENDGRSPLKPRQLHDLRLAPTATDPRPMFVWSAESGRDTAVTYSEYPKLLWHGVTNTEITVTSRDEELRKLDSGYVTLPIGSIEIDQVQNLADQLAGLSDLEQQAILEAQQQTRAETLVEKLANLPQADLERLLASYEANRKRAAKGKVA